MYKTEFEKFEY